MNKHINVALFVPHCGCPHMCSFCNQKTISGKVTPLEPSEVKNAAETALRTGGQGGEIAFFGGSFTAVDREYMTELLKQAKPYVDSGCFAGIRCSTRPDAVDEEVLDILKHYGVSAIELGAQSMDNYVLSLNERGHTAEDTFRASELIKSYGIELGLQMMTGLYGDTDAGIITTAEKFIEINPATVRIYPTIVLENTRLARLYEEKLYKPQTIDEAADICGKLLIKFYENNIKVIRVGLHSGGNVEEGYIAGPYHPAFRELCEGKIYLNKICSELRGKEKGSYYIYVNPSELSKATGQKKVNLCKLKDNGYNCKIVPKTDMDRYTVSVEKV